MVWRALRYMLFIVSPSRREEHAAGVRSVNGGVTERAGLVFDRLIVEGRGGGRPNLGRKRVAAEAQQINLVLHQHARIRGAVR